MCVASFELGDEVLRRVVAVVVVSRFRGSRVGFGECHTEVAVGGVWRV